MHLVEAPEMMLVSVIKPIVIFWLSFSIVTGQLLHCKSNLRGGNYAGKVSSTKSGIPCQRWDAQSPHSHDVTANLLPEKDVSAAENFCRSPDFDVGGPWCYTTDPQIVWEHCHIPACEISGCTDTPLGEGYIGAENRTVSGDACAMWTDISIFTSYGFQVYDRVSFSDGQVNNNFCRNPLGGKERPWCHSTDPDTDWEFCSVPQCERQYREAERVELVAGRLCEVEGGVCAREDCCTGGYHVGGLCGSTGGLVCCLSQVDCQWRQQKGVELWPGGSYSLPASIYGCPLTEQPTSWTQRYVTFMTSSSSRLQRNVTWSGVFRLAGSRGATSGFTLDVCERQKRLVPVETPRWPIGNYCFLRASGQICPAGFRELNYTIISMDYESFTSISLNKSCDLDPASLCLSFCCRADGQADGQMILPTSAPFYLLRNGAECPQVAGMDVTYEYIRAPLSEGTSYTHSGPAAQYLPVTFLGEKNNSHMTLNLCFYTSNADDTCYHPLDEGYWYRGRVNMTREGACSSWDDIYKFSRLKHYQHIGIDNNNYCRNTLLFLYEDRPWCYTGGRKVLCDIPQCDESQYADSTRIGVGRPARQQYGDWEEAQLAVDGNILTCSFQDQVNAWWQLDLQGYYTVMAVGIFRQNLDECVLRFVDVHVGFRADDFLSHGAKMCARNASMGSMIEAVTRCVQPVAGQFVTIDNLVYIGTDTYVDQEFEKCLMICEVEVYVKDTFCGRRLLEVAMANQVQPYIRDAGGREGPAFMYALHSAQAWCLPANQQPWLMINLLFTRKIQAIVTQGHQTDDAMVTQFHLKYGFSEDDLIYYEEYPTVKKLFVNDPGLPTPQTHLLSSQISASVVQLVVTNSYKAPCLRLDLLGCIKQFENFVGKDHVSQSSTLPERPLSLSVDNSMVTCSATLSQSLAWWQHELPKDTRIHSVVLQTGPTFAWNLAGGKYTRATTEAWSGYSNLASDGKMDLTSYWDGSCSHTFLHDHPWWAVDLGDTFNISTVQITNRFDCCYNRLDQFHILVGNTIPEAETAVNMSLYQLCATHDSFFGPAEVLRKDCVAGPLTGRYVLIVLPSENYLTLCEVQVYGQRVPMHVAIGSQESMGGERAAECRVQNTVLLGQSLHSYNCDTTPPGSSLNISIAGLGPMSVCSALVYGGKTAVIRTVSFSGRTFNHLTCAPPGGGTALHLTWRTLAPASDYTPDIYINKQDLQVLMSECEGSSECYIPASGGRTGTSPDTMVPITAICSAVKTREEQCMLELRTETEITTPNFPYYYGRDLQCQWRVVAPVGKYVVLNVTDFTLAGQVDRVKDGCEEYNFGVCSDVARVSYVTSQDVEEVITMETASVFHSYTNELVLSFSSCYRRPNLVRDKQFGLRAYTEFKDCSGCNVQMSGAGERCGGPCGHIMSYGYPSRYRHNERTEWLIVVEHDKFISLEFLMFDVYEGALSKCERDYVTVYDVDLLDQRTTSLRYCNSDPPRLPIVSSWYQMVIEFITDSTTEVAAAGFHAYYVQKTYQPAEDIPVIDDHPDCPSDWLWFASSCYNLEISSEPLTWQVAEQRCRSRGTDGHLVSIADAQEMAFLHFMLSTRWRSNDTRTFIGLTDSQEEGRWRWSDGSPMTYSAWSASSSYLNLRQPDGAEVEDCAMIRLDSIHSTDSWHDIPCAYDRLRQFLCELNTDLVENKTTSELEPEEGPVTTIPDHLVYCHNKELVLAYLWCDSKPDCRDGSDESNCTKDGAAACSSTNYQCTDGACVSMSLYCDSTPDCQDASDEANCIKPECEDTEYTCDNGQCISPAHSCDLQQDCMDGSDELNCVICSSDVAFQCFDGTCISIGKRCDGVVDCPGSLREDESEDCVAESIQPSCRHWRLDGQTATGKYLINPRGQGAFEVECDFSSEAGQILTIVHHDSEERKYVTGYQNPRSYIHQVHYAATIDQLVAMKMEVDRCEQYIMIECFGSGGLENDFWVNIAGEELMWNTATDEACKCQLSTACEANRTGCWCEEGDTIIPRRLLVDAGYLTTMEDLPMTAISLSGTAFKDWMYEYHSIGPLVCHQGGNVVRDEIRCSSGKFINQTHRCIYDVDAFGDNIGCRDTSHLENCGSFQCPSNLFKCANSFCIPVRMLCNGVRDCLSGEDELNCEEFTCPGYYKCRHQSFCIETNQRCDGVRQCPLADDEEMCDVICPSGCTCTGYAFQCQAALLKEPIQSLPHNLRKLDISGIGISMIAGANISGFDFLGELIMAYNDISEIQPFTFIHLKNLYHLDLSFNDLVVLEENTFAGLVNLQVLNLLGNERLAKINTGSFKGLQSLPALLLTSLALKDISEGAFIGLPALQNLDISDNDLQELQIGVFDGLDDLVSLNASANKGLSMKRDVLNDLHNLAFLQSDDFKYCCFVSEHVPEENCLPPRDELSSCQDLMRRDILKAFLWILGLMALLCNAFVIIWRSREKKFTVYSFSVFNLAVSDFIMGFYMVTLAIVDIYYRGVYIEYADSWQQSSLCEVLGVLNTISSEASVFILCLISGDRFYNIVFPFKAMQGGKSLRNTVFIMLFIWAAATVLAILPLFPLDYFKGGYYSRSGMCISIHLTKEASPGWEFSVAIFHGMNFSCFLFIFLSYAYMYQVVAASTKASTSGGSGKARASDADIKLARRITLVVATDFLCWVPINIMGAAALCGVSIPGEVYAWVVVFLLPVNSAINPLLYTISAISLIKKSAKANKSAATVSTIASESQLLYIQTPKLSKTLKEFLTAYQQLPVPVAWRLLVEITRVVAEAHQNRKSAGTLDAANVYIIHSGGTEFIVGLQILPRMALGDMAEADDVTAMGRLFSTILRRCAKVK